MQTSCLVSAPRPDPLRGKLWVMINHVARRRLHISINVCLPALRTARTSWAKHWSLFQHQNVVGDNGRVVRRCAGTLGGKCLLASLVRCFTEWDADSCSCLVDMCFNVGWSRLRSCDTLPEWLTVSHSTRLIQNNHHHHEQTNSREPQKELKQLAYVHVAPNEMCCSDCTRVHGYMTGCMIQLVT